jgi:biopolymer transport protein ExbB
LSGLNRIDSGFLAAKESSEITAKNEVSKLWENISYLSDLSVISPFVGLLGTVLGMIQAFNTIAFQSAVVKPILLAGGVSKAMVTTAGGLTVAIPAVIFYAFFRGRVVRISGAVESLTNEIVDVLAEAEKKR